MSKLRPYDQIVSALVVAGLVARGGFRTRRRDDFGDTISHPVGAVVLAGNVGSSMWPSFARDRRDEDNPLDQWSKRKLGAIAESLPGNVTAVFPSDGPPYWPFQQWAMRSEPVHPSPIGPLIHPIYGLWHAYRGALLFEDRIEIPAMDRMASPCLTCEDKPCLSTCPVGALTVSKGLDTKACVGYLKSEDGDACLAAGCLARRACPAGVGLAYMEDQARFHMSTFFNARLAALEADERNA